MLSDNSIVRPIRPRYTDAFPQAANSLSPPPLGQTRPLTAHGPLNEHLLAQRNGFLLFRRATSGLQHGVDVTSRFRLAHGVKRLIVA